MQQNKAKKVRSWSLWKLAVGVVLVPLGVLCSFAYFADIQNYAAGIGTVVLITAGGAFAWLAFSKDTGGYSFSNKKFTGKENALLILARRNGGAKDIPWCLKLASVPRIPQYARRHYLRNEKRFVYELWNNPRNGNKLEAVTLPDKQSSFTPGKFQIVATMQPYKDAIDYNPPSTAQKLAPGLILLAMVIIGFLIIATTG